MNVLALYLHYESAALPCALCVCVGMPTIHACSKACFTIVQVLNIQCVVDVPVRRSLSMQLCLYVLSVRARV